MKDKPNMQKNFLDKYVLRYYTGVDKGESELTG